MVVRLRCNATVPVGNKHRPVPFVVCIVILFYVATMLRVSFQTNRTMLETTKYKSPWRPSIDAPSNYFFQFKDNTARGDDETINFDRSNDLKSLNEDDATASAKADDESSFSACILWMDDNHRLEEWLAYHYYFLKLRYVVINIDPWSRTSPQAIIDRWNDHENNYNLNMTIVTMRDSEYVLDYDKEIEIIQEAAEVNESDAALKYGQVKTNYHRHRQRQFYKACSQHLIQQNKSWTSFHDTDEFLTMAHTAKKQDIAEISSRKMEHPGYVLDRLNWIKEQLPPDTYVNETGVSCLIVDRKRYCAKELSTEETNNLFRPSSGSNTDGIIPEGFMNSSIDGSTDHDRESIVRRFDTIRYKYLTHGIDGMPKSFIDLSQPNTKLYAHDQWYKKANKTHPWNTHRAMTGLCISEQKHRLTEFKTMVEEERFIVSHYLGNFESYSFRDDARQGGLRNYEVWEKRSQDTLGEVSLVIRPWLRGFVELVGGPSVASYLLQDAGKFPDDYDIEARINEYRQSYDWQKGVRRAKTKKTQRKRKRKKISFG